MHNRKNEKQQILSKNSKRLSKIATTTFLKNQAPTDPSPQPDQTRMLQWLSQQIQKYSLRQFLGHGYKFTLDSLTTEKKYSQISKGVYILVRGKVCCTSINRIQFSDKREYLFGLAKSGVFLFYGNPCHIDPQLEGFQSWVIEEPFTLFECETNSCLALEQCDFIRIEEETLEGREFYKLERQRRDLVENCHIEGQNNSEGKLFAVNLCLYSTFKRYEFAFHSVIELQTLAIVSSGVLRPKKGSQLELLQKLNHLHQMEKYSILLPGVAYDVASTSASILVIEGNPTLSFKHPHLILAHKSLSARIQKKPVSSHFRLTKTSCSSLHMSRTESQITKNLSRWQINKRRKKLTEISKKYQNELIITMQTCKQSLSFSEKQTERLKESSEKNILDLHNQGQKSQRKKPNILFDYTKYCTSKSVKSFCKAFQDSGSGLTIEIEGAGRFRKERKTFGESLMSRYKKVSRDLYEKFRTAHNSPLYRKKENLLIEPGNRF